MIRRTRGLGRAALALLLLLPCTTGCTVLMAGAGGALDLASARRHATPDELRSLRAGSAVRLVLEDGSRLDGVYLGLAASGADGAGMAFRFRAATAGSIASPPDSPGGAGERIIPFADVRQMRRARQLGYGLVLLPIGVALDMFALYRLSHYD